MATTGEEACVELLEPMDACASAVTAEADVPATKQVIIVAAEAANWTLRAFDTVASIMRFKMFKDDITETFSKSQLTRCLQGVQKENQTK